MMHLLLPIVGTITLSLITLAIVYFRLKFSKLRSAKSSKFQKLVSSANDNESHKIIAFFHPHCSAGGGGERVLWKCIHVLADLREKMGVKLNIVIYTTDEPKESYRKDLFEHVKSRFSITIPSSLPLGFVHINDTNLTSDTRRFSMIAESIQTMKMAYHALCRLTPDIYIDTTGCAFTFLVASLLAGCKVGAYVHYPTISTDMLSLVWERRPTYNNDSKIATNTFISYIKLVYYLLFAICYGVVGSLATLVMVNSSWTYAHIRSLWRFTKIDIVYPPCDTTDLAELPLEPRENVVVSIGQFRPEKDHELQLRAFSLVVQKLKENDMDIKPQLVLIGSCRGEEDNKRVIRLCMLAQEQKVAESVTLVLNQDYATLKGWLGKATIGLHTMWNEHFGIGVVEMMAAGVIIIAHDSGGPKADIVVPLDGKKTGYLATTAEEYAHIMYNVFTKGNDCNENLMIRRCARKSAMRFSDEVFMDSFKSALLSSRILT